MNMSKEIFPKLEIKENEQEIFNNYLKIKGIYLHKQIYDIIMLSDEKATYSEISYVIRYDKYLRNVLYKYLSALEEQWQSLVFNNLDYDSSKKEALSKNISMDKIINKNGLFHSTFYWASYNKNFTLNKLIEILKSKRGIIDINISDNEFDSIIKLRNSVMHHNLILFSYHETKVEVEEEIRRIEKRIMLLYKLLDESMKDEFKKAINMGNYKGGNCDACNPNLNRYCLRRFKNGIFI